MFRIQLLGFDDCFYGFIFTFLPEVTSILRFQKLGMGVIRPAESRVFWKFRTSCGVSGRLLASAALARRPDHSCGLL